MRITRLKRGYRIRLSDSEYAALSMVFSYGEGDVTALEEHEWDEMSAAERRGMRTVTGQGSWAVDDRRDSKPESVPLKETDQ